jgi:hypothetical protein
MNFVQADIKQTVCKDVEWMLLVPDAVEQSAEPFDCREVLEILQAISNYKFLEKVFYSIELVTFSTSYPYLQC